MSFTTPIAESDVTSLVTDLAAKAPLATPTFTGHPVGVTEAALNNSTRLATTAYIDTAVGVEATRAAVAEALLAPKASPTLTGTVTVPNGASASNIAAFGQIPTPGSVGGPAKVVFRTSNSATKSNSTFASDDTLTLAVGANDRWLIHAYLTIIAADNGGSASTADAKFTWNVPASGAMQHGILGGTTTIAFAAYGAAVTAQSPLVLKTAGTAVQTQGTDNLTSGMALAGFYTGGGTSGTLALQWAQGTTNVATLQLATNSLLLCWRVA